MGEGNGTEKRSKEIITKRLRTQGCRYLQSRISAASIAKAGEIVNLIVAKVIRN